MNTTLSEKHYMDRIHGPVDLSYYATRRKTIGYTVLSRLSLAGTLVLDIGAFAGFVGNHCREMGARVILVDIFSKAFPSFMEGVQGSNELLPFKDRTFDFIVCGDTLHHGNLLATTAEIHRVLKSSGVFVSVQEPCISSAEDEDEVLAKDCSNEIAGGICEHRPNLYQYQEAFSSFSSCTIYNGADLGPATDKNWGGEGIIIEAIA